MLKAVFLREMLDSFISRKFLLIFLLCCTMLPLSIVINQRALRQFDQFQSRALSDYQGAMTGMMPADQVEVKAFRPRSDLAGLAAGLELALPSSISIRRDGVSFGLTQLLDNPVVALFGRVDLLFIVKLILSLVAIALSFSMICGEKESGTLRLTLANPIPRDSVLLGKFLSAVVTLVVPVAAGLLMSFLLLLLMGDRAVASASQWLALSIMFLISVLYLTAFLSLGALVSSLTTRSLTAITILLFLWACLTMVVPQMGGLLAETIYPVESQEDLLLKKSLVAQDSDRRRAAELRPHFRDPSYEEIRKPVALRYAVELQRTLAQLDQEHENKRRTQLRIAGTIASLSPVTPLTFAFTSLAGTGVLEVERFNRALGNFRTEVDEKVFSTGYRDLVPGGGGAMMIGTIDLKDVPRFHYEGVPLAEVLRSIRGAVLLLVLFNGVFFLSAYFRFRHYDVR